MKQAGLLSGRWLLSAAIVLGVAGATVWHVNRATDTASAPRSGKRPFGGDRPQPVQAAAVVRGDADITLQAPGTVMARNTATVRARVTGQLVRIAFHEGQLVRAGEILAEIDSRPFQAQLDQAAGQLARDEAQLSNARVDLARYRSLLQQDAIASQQVDAQEALVRQYEGTVKNDRGLLDAARLQLDFTRIRAPFDGRLGLRQVDAGNLVQPGDANGLVVMTQTRPINVVFAIPADKLAGVLERQRAGKTLAVDAYDSSGSTRLAQGRLVSIDNQVDTSTGTVKLKAEFANADERLFPNQFVNIRLQENRLHNVLLAPSAAVQRGSQGSFMLVVADDGRVAMRPVSPGVVSASGEQVVIEHGLKEGDRVVIDGADKLKDGAKVEISQPGAGKAASAEDATPRAGKSDGARSNGNGHRSSRPQ